MARSLRSKRARRNRALQAEKKAPRILQRMKDSMAAAEEFNVSVLFATNYLKMILIVGNYKSNGVQMFTTPPEKTFLPTNKKSPTLFFQTLFCEYAKLVDTKSQSGGGSNNL